MMYVLDQEGKEMLTLNGHQVMMQWEKVYKEACIDAIEPYGDVLEVSFGFGFSSSHIQTYFPKSHTIIERHDEVVKRADNWASPYTNVKIINDHWTSAMDNLGVFDAIYFDDYIDDPFLVAEGVEEELSTAIELLKEGEFYLANINRIIPDLYKRKYTKGDLIFLFEQKGKDDIRSFLHFVDELLFRGQIHSSYKREILMYLVQEKGVSPQQMNVCKMGRQYKLEGQKKGGSLLSFLETCLTDHMRKGSRFSCFLSDPKSKYEDKYWFDKIIKNPFLDYKEKRISVDVPKHCQYYHAKEALVITITKK